MANNSRNNNQDSQALTVVQPPRLPMPPQAAGAGLDEGQWKALVDAVFPSAKSVDGVMLAVNYAKARGLDIFKRVVHVVPMYNAALGREVETVWPGIAEMRTTASRTGLWAGNDECQFGATKCEAFKDKRTTQGRGNNSQTYVTEEACEAFDFPEWAQVTVYKIVAGQRVAFVGPKVRFKETFSGIKGLNVPNARWQRAPFQMLEKCAEAAALRRAFPDELGDEWSAEEMEGKNFEGAAGAQDAEFSVIDEEKRKPAEQEPTRESTQQESDEDRAERELREWWGPGGMEEFLSYMEDGFSSVKTEGAVDKALRAEAEAIGKLPPAEKARLDGWVADARARIADAPAGNKPAAKESEEDAGEAAEDTDNGPYVRYIENLERQAKQAETAVDVNSLKGREKQSIDALPQPFNAEAEAILEIAMKVAKSSGASSFDELLSEYRDNASGNAAPAAEDETAAENDQ